MLGQPEGEHRRFRLGIIFLVIGLLLVLWAWGSWVFRVSAGGGEQPTGSTPIHKGSLLSSDGPTPGSTDSRAVAHDVPVRGPEIPTSAKRLVPLTSLTIVLLLIVFLFGSFAVVVGTRRWRALAEHKRAPPTANADVWAMHKLPEDLLD